MSIQTSDLEGAAEAAPDHPNVHDARLVDRRDVGGQRVLEIVLGSGIDRIPPGVLRTLADHDCGIATAQPQGEFLVVVAN